jgi:hypothetical protein
VVAHQAVGVEDAMPIPQCVGDARNDVTVRIAWFKPQKDYQQA